MMNRTVTPSRVSALVIALAALVLGQNAFAQSRSFGAQSFILDDNLGHRMQITTPQPGDPGYAQWILGGALSWRLPIPPTNGASMAFVQPGSSANQVLVWNPPTASGGTGGAEGTWTTGLVQPSNVQLGAGQFLMGNGSNLGSAVSLSGDVASVSPAGVVTFNNSPGTRSDLGLGSIATQNANNVAISGGAINGTAIGAGGASTGAFTTATASTSVSSPSFTSTGSTLNIGPSTNGGGTGYLTTISGGQSSLNGSNGGNLNINGGSPGTGGNFGTVNINTLGGDVNIGNASGSVTTISGTVVFPPGSLSSSDISLAQNALMVGDASSHGSALASGGNNLILETNGTGVPTWTNTLPAVSGANLTNLNASNITSGTLSVTRGGTGSTSFTGDQIVVSNAAGTALVSGGAGTTTQVLHGNAGGAPSYGAIVNGDLTSGAYSSITGLGSQSQSLNMNTHAITGVVDPSGAQDAATKNYVDGLTGPTHVVTTFSAGTTGLTPSSATTGAVTLAGTLAVGNGGTGATTLTAHGVVVGNGTSAVAITSAGAANTVLRGTGAASDPTFGAIDNNYISTGVYSNITGLGSQSQSLDMNTHTITGVVDPSGAQDAATKNYVDGLTGPTHVVTSFSAGTTGLTPNSATTGAVSLGGTLNVANGGTGVSTASANTFFAGPTAGLSAAPSFRALTAADFPTGGINASSISLAQNSLMVGDGSNHGSALATAANGVLVTDGTGVPSISATLPAVSGANITNLNAGNITSGTLSVTRGGTGSTSFTGEQIVVSNAAGTALVSGGAGTTTQVLHGNAGGAPSYGAIVNGDLTSGAYSSITGMGSQSQSLDMNTHAITGVVDPSGAQDAATKNYVDGLTGPTHVVTTFSAGTTGLTPSSATTGAVTLAGTLNVANGGTGVSAASANTFFAGPTAGLAAAPSFRALDAADFPTGGINASSISLTQNSLMVGDGSNHGSALATAANGVLVTDGTGVPSISATLPAVSGANITNLNAGNISSGTLSVTRGGTGSTSFTGDQIVVSNAAGTALVSGGAGTTTQVLHGNAGGAPSYGVIVNGDLTSGAYSNITGLGSQSQSLNMNTHAITGVVDPSGAQDAATKNYVDGLTGPTHVVTTFSAGTTGLTPSSATTGAVTLAGTLAVGNGGTGATTLTAHGVVIGNGTSAVAITAAGAANTVLRGTGAASDPTFGAIDNNYLSSGDYNSITGIGSQTEDLDMNTHAITGVVDPSGAQDAATKNYVDGLTGPTHVVTSFSAGTTGLTPNSATMGAVTLSGTLAIANGGTGQATRQEAINALAGAVTAGRFLRGDGSDVTMSTITASDVPNLDASKITTGTLSTARGGLGLDASSASNGQVPIGNGSGLVLNTLTQGTNVSIANGAGTITIGTTANPTFATSVTTPLVTNAAAMSMNPSTNAGGAGYTTSLAGGASSNATSNGGDVNINGGAPGAGGNYGTVNIQSTGGNVMIGNTGGNTTINGGLTTSGTTVMGYHAYDPGTGNNASVTIGNYASVDILSNTNTGTLTITLPTETDGQVLYVHNANPRQITVAAIGGSIPSTATAMYIGMNGSWILNGLH